MKHTIPTYQRHRFPSEIISHAVWLYHRFCLSFREVEELLAERGITVTYETIRQWCQKFGQNYARKLKKRQGRLGKTWHIDEVFVTIQGQRHCLYRAVDRDGDVIDILLQRRRNQRAAERFFRRLLKGQGGGTAVFSHRQTSSTIRQWCQKFGQNYARKLKKRQGRLGKTWHIDEVFVTIQGQRHCLYRAVDRDGDVIDILLQRRRNQRAAERFFRRLLKGQGGGTAVFSHRQTSKL